MLTVACVRTGTTYGTHYVHALHEGFQRHLKIPHRFVCLTDRPGEVMSLKTVTIPATYNLAGWWGKMMLFEPSWRGNSHVLYCDLDNVAVGDLGPLAEVREPFAICANFTRAAGNTDWPCRYGSTVMSIAPEFGAEVWNVFKRQRDSFIRENVRYGDQAVIELLAPDAKMLQPLLPDGFFMSYRDLSPIKPTGTAMVVFAGKAKPDTCEHQWVREQWF